MDMSSPLAAPGLPTDEGFLTPRAKVAKMLADIDNAPTPSPSAMARLKTLEDSISAPQPPSNLDATSSQASSKTSNNEDQIEQGPEPEDSDDSVRRPQGRAARRMLGARAASSTPSSAKTSSQARTNSPVGDNEDDLYSATPMKKRPKAAVRSISSSPPASEHGNGPFVSPAKPVDPEDDDLPSNPFGSKEKLAELVALKRAERLARETDKKKRMKATPSAPPSSDLLENAIYASQEDAVDPNIEKIMSDASRPARKASKKALLEMERETQRLARQQALAHQMKVKKKFTTNDLFAKFNFKKPGAAPATTNDPSTEGDTTASSAPNSDGVEERTKDPVSTPPSSPPTPLDRQTALVETGALSKLMPVRQDSLASLAGLDEDEELLEMAEIFKSSQLRKAAQVPPGEETAVEKKGLKLARLGKKAAAKRDDSSDDELEIIQAIPAHVRAFDKVAASTRPGRSADSKAIHNLKHLSHLHANDAPKHKKGARPSINPKTLDGQLRMRAKEQARIQQLERIEELRAKGIEVQTAEEKEQEAEAFENLLEKARQDAVELRKAEKAARKGADGEDKMEASDDEDEEDEDYVGSGTEDEEIEAADEIAKGDENGMIDDVVEETDEDEEDDGSEQEVEEDAATEPDVDVEYNVGEDAHEGANDEEVAHINAASRKVRKSRVIKDDEDDETEPEEAANFATQSEDSDPFAAFNFGADESVNPLLSPTQAFNATMQTPTQTTQEDSFDILRRIAPPSSSLPPTLPEPDTQFDDEKTEVSSVVGSQVPESQRINLNWETQPPETPVPAGLQRDVSALSETPGWEPTQDPGLPSPWSVAPKMRRESTLDTTADEETQSTVLLRISESPAPSQTAPRRGRLVRRQAALEDDSDEDIAPPASLKAAQNDAFREMARRRKEALTAAERAEADKEMRQMMDEQAEESEDEYAGLGGDDFVAPETEEDKEMIDSSHIEVDERALAAHFAERQRLRDEAQTSKLYKDLTTGVLRRKMGANAFDLDEDEDELAVRRRQMRQREEARKRKALLKDENIATLAEGRQSKGKDAFLKAIADDDGDDEVVNLSDGEEDSVPATQDDSQQSLSGHATNGPLQEASGNKRRLVEDDSIEERLPAKQRRTLNSAFRRPTSLLEVKESVSFLLDEPDTGAFFGPTALEPSSDSETDERMDDSEDEEVTAEDARQNDGGFAPNPMSMEAKSMPPPPLPACQRRTPAKLTVVDRLSLKRGSSTSDSALGRTAWVAGPTTGGFKSPSLLRRATTNSSENDRGVTTSNGLSRENSGGSVKMGGTKKSSLAYQARAEERKAIVEASTKRREENTRRIAQMRRNSSALGRGLTGRFE